MIFFRTISLLAIGFLTSCQVHHLNVQTQYLTHENLASYYVGTPDPEKDCPTIGQRLLIEWSLPTDDLCSGDLKLNLKIRFRNKKEDEVWVPINEKSGTYLYYVINKKYCQTGGIATYKVDLIGNGCILETWQHPLWSELITFQIPQNHFDPLRE
ncbi:MAG: hypothetical protein ACHQUC_03055 [Chlamydiales bacterium]